VALKTFLTCAVGRMPQNSLNPFSKELSTLIFLAVSPQTHLPANK